LIHAAILSAQYRAEL